MEGVLGIFKSIISLDSSLCKVYLDALDEHQSFAGKSQAGTDEVVQAISSLLAKRDCRSLGLLLLNQFVDQCANIDVLEQKANLWTTLTLKASSKANELESYGSVVYDTLAKLAKRAQQSPDLSKTFASNHLAKIYESINYVPESGQLAALHCIETCLRLYPGPSGPSKGAVERYLLRFIDTTDEQVSQCVGKCQHLLQQVRGGQGLNHKIQWQNYQLRLLASLHALLDEAFSKSSELYDDNIVTGDQLEVPALELSDEPVQRAAQLYIRFRNLLEYLQTALCEPFPVEKPIMPKKILNFINRGLSMTCSVLQRNAILDHLALGALLPKMHMHLLQLLQALMLALRGHLRMHHELILSVLVDTLKWTSKQSVGAKKPLANLRSKTYELISIWSSIMRTGSRCELVAEYLIPEIINDVYPYQAEFTLKVLSGARKHMSKKARRQLHKAQNEQSNLAQTHANNPIRKEDLSDEGNQRLCIAALRCLQDVLLSASNFVKPTLLKIVHTKILSICGLFYELPLRRQHLYSSWQCRAEIYHCLYILLLTPHHLCPPPTQMAITILQTAHLRDGNTQVRRKCGTLILTLEKLIHPQKESLLFPVEARDIRNTFIKLGKEHLLKSSLTDSNVEEQTEMSDMDDEIEDADLQIHFANTPLEKADEQENQIEDDHSKVEVADERKKNSVVISPESEDIKTLSNDTTVEEDSNSTSTGPQIIEEDENIGSDKITSNNDSDCVAIDSEDDENTLTAPVAKKLKLDNRLDSQLCETPSSDGKFPAPISNMEEDDDLLVADIEAAFVDELNE